LILGLVAGVSVGSIFPFDVEVRDPGLWLAAIPKRDFSRRRESRARELQQRYDFEGATFEQTASRLHAHRE